MTELRQEASWPRATLDRDYRARDCVSPDIFDRIIGAYRHYSSIAMRDLHTRANLTYDPASGQTLDLYGTDGATKRPVVICIHGGYWRALSRAETAFMAPSFAARGIATAVPDYTLAPSATLSEIVRQMRAALAFLWHRADNLGIDRTRILVTGSSAGGHLAACLISPGWQAGMGLPEQPIRAALPISGLFELAPIASSHVQDWIALTPAEVEVLSPLRHPPVPAPNTVVAHAETETPGFYRQSIAYASRLGAPRLMLPGRNHFDVFLDLMDQESLLFRTALDLLD